MLASVAVVSVAVVVAVVVVVVVAAVVAVVVAAVVAVVVAAVVAVVMVVVVRRCSGDSAPGQKGVRRPPNPFHEYGFQLEAFDIR